MNEPWEFKIEFDGETLERFFVDQSDVAFIQGPYGSGKSVACCKKLFHNAIRQPIGPTGRRRRRTYIVRETYDQIKRSVLKTWRQQFPPHVFGEVMGNGPLTQTIRVADLEWEVIFLALDGNDDESKLESAEASDAWVNEARHLRFSTVKMLADRLGRYPPHAEEGCILPQLIMDTNAPPEDHPLTVMSGQRPIPDGIPEEDRALYAAPKGWTFHLQPAAALPVRDEHGRVTAYELNPRRENQRFLPPDYYLRLLAGASQKMIRERVLSVPGTYRDGRAVWPDFRPELHVAPKLLEAIPGHPLLVGVDFGRNPAAVIAQCVFNRWRVLREVVAENMGADRFAPILKRELAQHFPGMAFHIWGDPSGGTPGQATDHTPFMIFRAHGLPVLPAPGENNLELRLGAVTAVLTSTHDGMPRFQVSPNCIVLKTGMEGGYEFARMRVDGVLRYSDQPSKNRYSHPCDALQYVVLGGGEGRAVLTGNTGNVGAPLQGRVVQATRARGWGLFQRGRR